MSDLPIVHLDALTKVYDLGEIKVPALRGLDLKIEEGCYVAIMGSSGSGKSTLLNVLGCLDRPTDGRYLLGGTDVSAMTDDELSDVRGQKIGFVFQQYNLIDQLTVVENIHVPLFYQGRDLSEEFDFCLDVAKKVGLGGMLDHRPKQL